MLASGPKISMVQPEITLERRPARGLTLGLPTIEEDP
jgi:hypothetical protein